MHRGFIVLCLVGFGLVSLIGESELKASSSEKISGQKPHQKTEEKAIQNDSMTQAKETPEKPYTALVEKNIFSPERKEFPIPTATGSMKKPPVRPQVVLYGVTLAGDYQSASLVHTGRTLRKGEREILTLRVGEKIAEYKLAKILSDRILLETEEDSFEVLLYDAAKPKPRTAVKTESKPATVTSAIPSPARPAPAEPTQPGVPGTPTVSSPVPGPEKGTTPPLSTPGVPFAITPSTAPPPQPATPSTSPVYPLRRRVPIPAQQGTPSPETTSPQTVPKESGGP